MIMIAVSIIETDGMKRDTVVKDSEKNINEEGLIDPSFFMSKNVKKGLKMY
jgi:hypothetical protein